MAVRLPNLGNNLRKEKIKEAPDVGSEIVDQQNTMVDSLDRLVDLMSRLVQIQEGILDESARARLDKFRELEAQREAARSQEGAGTTGAEGDGPGFGLLALAGIAALVAGFFAGVLDAVKRILQITKLDNLFKGIGNLFKAEGAIGKLFTRFRTRWVAFIDDAIIGLRTFFSGLRSTVLLTFEGIGKIVDDLIQPFKAIFNAEGAVGSRINKLFNGIIDIFKFPFEPIIDDLGKGVKAIFGGGDDISILAKIGNLIRAPFDAALASANKALGVIRSAFSIFDEGSKFMGILGSIGRVLGRLFLPLTFIMTAYDTVKGAIQGFEEEGFLGALAGGVEGFLNSIIGAPLDLLKKGASFLLKKLGFTDAASVLEGFNFSDIITDIIRSPFELLKRAFNGVIEVIAEFIESVDIPFVDEKKMANDLRGFKFEEGQTKSEQRAGATKIESGQKKMEELAAEAERNELKIAELESDSNYSIGGNRLTRGQREEYAEKLRRRNQLIEDEIVELSEGQTPDLEPNQGLSPTAMELARKQEEADKAGLANGGARSGPMVNAPSVSVAETTANYNVQGRPAATPSKGNNFYVAAVADAGPAA